MAVAAPSEDDDIPVGDRCPVCELPAGECDHLVASLDLTYSEVISGAIFAHERTIFDLLEHLASSDPETLKVVGAGPELEYLASLVLAEIEEGSSVGDAVAIHYPEIIATLSFNLQEDGEVLATTVDADSAEDSSIENLWAREAEPIVERLIARYQGLAQEVDEA